MRVRCDPYFPDPETLRLVERAIKTSSLLVFPTETVYGIGCIFTDIGGLQKIFALKHRPRDLPVALMFPTVERAVEFLGLEGWVEEAVRTLLPNPITVLVPRPPGIALNSYVEGADHSVGIRVPDHPLVISICALFRAPLAVTSANLHGARDPRTFNEITIAMDEDVLALDAGPTALGQPSTVVKLMPEARRLTVIREGAFPGEKLPKEVIPVG
ncbi:MAG: L-threonylcarbamoyladenylate synthase [bacterium JZ-2024 1]